MGFWKALAGVGKTLLGPIVGAGRSIQKIRDKGVALFNKVKDSLPGFIKAPLDAGIEFVMNTPVGRAIKGASGLLDAGVGAGDAALSKIKEYEAQTGQPAAAQLAAIGERAQAADAPAAPPDDAAQQARLENLAAGAAQ